MAIVRVMAIFHRDGGVPADDTVNTWVFDGTGAAATVAADAITKLKAFYAAIDQNTFSSILSGAVDYKAYDLADAEPRVPVATDTQTLTVSGGDPLPAELAICLSFNADYVSGYPNARRRGRVFLGPLAMSVAEVSGADVRVAAGSMSQITAAAAFLTTGAGDADLAVYSPTTHETEGLIESTGPVVRYWVDNAFDVQRRRGSKATARSTVEV